MYMLDEKGRKKYLYLNTELALINWYDKVIIDKDKTLIIL